MVDYDGRKMRKHHIYVTHHIYGTTGYCDTQHSDKMRETPRGNYSFNTPSITGTSPWGPLGYSEGVDPKGGGGGPPR